MPLPKHTVTILGSLVAILAFLGFPGTIKTPAFFILGLLIAYMSYQEHSHHKKSPSFKRAPRKMKGAVSIPVATSTIPDTNPMSDSEISTFDGERTQEPHIS